MKNPDRFDWANFGNNKRKNKFRLKLRDTFPIFINAYIIGFFSARSFENGIIAKASNARIQIVNVTYSRLIFDQREIVFLYNKEIIKKVIDDQKTDIVAVDITFFLFASVL